jgi:DNA-binding transcriptional LysR family regulator
VLEPQGKPARAWAETTCRAAGFDPLVRFESADLLVRSQLAETGHAAALLPDLVWDARPAAAQFVVLPGNPKRQVYTAVRADAENRPVLVELRRVLDTVVQGRGLKTRPHVPKRTGR